MLTVAIIEKGKIVNNYYVVHKVVSDCHGVLV